MHQMPNRRRPTVRFMSIRCRLDDSLRPPCTLDVGHFRLLINTQEQAFTAQSGVRCFHPVLARLGAFS